MQEAYIVSAARTPIGKFLGVFSRTPATKLGARAAAAAIERAGLKPEHIDETIFGHARQAGCGPNPARQVAHAAGIPTSSPAYTVNKACASGLKSIVLAKQAVMLGDADIVLAGGQENMTRTPFMLQDARLGYRLGSVELTDGMYKDGFICPLCSQVMGETAENLARKYDISREECDTYAMATQHRCEAATKGGRFKKEITPVRVKVKREEVDWTNDEHPRYGVTMEGLGKLPLVFKEDGVVTAGNASGITDGAAAVVVASQKAVEKHGLSPLARIGEYANVGVEPDIMGIGPVPAMAKLQGKTGRAAADYDLIELNEAFAAQVIAVLRESPLSEEKLNVNGGAIALGHPIGATGARIVVTLLYEMRRRKVKSGLATLCVSGGLGTAVEFLAG